VLTRAVKDLKIYADRFAAQIPTLEDKVKHHENKVVDRQTRSGPGNSVWSTPLEQMRIIRNRTLG
jgi:hypothetical protein